MTAFDRFDPFERRISGVIDEIAAARRPDYLDDILRQTARRAQRPRWSFPERWFNVDATLARPFLGRRVPIRLVVVALLVLALVASALAFYIGSFRQLPSPLGIARNGQIVYGSDGDIYVRDSLTATPRLLLSGPSQQGGVAVSPDGQLIAYDDVVGTVDHVWVANIDGSNPRQILDRAFTGQTFQWAYDSRSAVAITDSAGFDELWAAPADGSGARAIELDGLWPKEATWDPTRPGVLLVRVEDRTNGAVDLMYVDVSGSTTRILSRIDMPDVPILNGSPWQFVGIAFSPDGSKIAYALAEPDNAAGDPFRTWLMNHDGSDARRIDGPSEPAYNQSWPVFSPDGRWIALESWLPTSTGSVNTLALAPSDLSSPAVQVGPSYLHSLLKVWSPDGTRLLVHPQETTEVWSIDPISRTYEQLPWGMDYVPGWQRLAP